MFGKKTSCGEFALPPKSYIGNPMFIQTVTFPKWRQCKSKAYYCYFCIPPKGTVVIDRHAITEADMTLLSACSMSGLVSKHEIDNMYLKWSTVMKLWNASIKGVSFQKLLRPDLMQMNPLVDTTRNSQYGFLYHGHPINMDTTVIFMDASGCMHWTPLSVIMKNYVIADSREAIVVQNYMNQGQEVNNCLCLNWIKIEPIYKEDGFALPVPVEYVGKIKQLSTGNTFDVNCKYVNHGNGDFIVCRDDGRGNPNVNTAFALNGILFAKMFNNSGFLDSIADYAKKLPDPKPIPVF